MIRKFLLSTVAMAAIGSTAFAADLPSRRTQPAYVAPVPLFSWTGFYLGGDVGYAFGRDSVRNFSGVGPDVFYQTGAPSGTTGGAHIGYNLSTQSLPILGPIAGGFSSIPFIGGFGGAGGVVGVEGDVQGTDYRSNVAFGPTTFTSRNEISGSARGRIGIAVDRALFFATGGAAFAQFQNSYAGPFFAGGFSQPSHTRIGWTVGGGMEYALTTQFSLRAEYRYSDFGRYTDFPAFAAGAAASAFQHHDTMQRVTVGFSYKFDTPMAAPVVARY